VARARHGIRPECRSVDLDTLPRPTLSDLAGDRESIFNLSTTCRSRDRLTPGVPGRPKNIYPFLRS
jgi:hypothetical protein